MFGESVKAAVLDIPSICLLFVQTLADFFSFLYFFVFSFEIFFGQKRLSSCLGAPLLGLEVMNSRVVQSQPSVEDPLVRPAN